MTNRSWIVIVAMSAAVGCGSAEEECNGAKVEAYDAWEAVAAALDAEAAAVVETPLPPPDQAPEASAGPPNRYGIAGVDPEEVRRAHLRTEARLEADRHRDRLTREARDARHMRDLARGGALAYRDAAGIAVEELGQSLDAALRERVARATASHWESCSPVSP
jgi:hypothetical protein